MANCVGNLPRGPNTGANSSCAFVRLRAPTHLATSYNSKVHAGTITSGGRFEMTRFSRFTSSCTMSLITKLSSKQCFLGHTLRSLQVAVAGVAPD